MTFQLICTAILALIMGVLALVAGYRLFLLLLPIWGFFAGFAVGAHATTLIFGTGFLSTVTSWIVGFVVAVIFAVLSYLIYLVGVALLSAAFGYFLGAGIMLLFLDPGLIVTLVGLAGAVVMAFVVLAFNIQKPVLEFITSFGGATAVLTGVLLLFGRIPLESLGGNPVRAVLNDSIFWLIVWLVLGFVGFGMQIASNRTYVIEAPENRI
ncbi:MAG: TM7S3/TM198-like domain-containing protein [Anaerolineales bacterium]